MAHEERRQDVLKIIYLLDTKLHDLYVVLVLALFQLCVMYKQTHGMLKCYVLYCIVN